MARTGTQATVRRGVSSVGRSFRLCTAASIRPSSRARSSSRTKTPSPPMAAIGTSSRRSPCVEIVTISTAWPWLRSCSTTQPVCVRASRLARVPTRIGASCPADSDCDFMPACCSRLPRSTLNGVPGYRSERLSASEPTGLHAHRPHRGAALRAMVSRDSKYGPESTRLGRRSWIPERAFERLRANRPPRPSAPPRSRSASDGIQELRRSPSPQAAKRRR